MRGVSDSIPAVFFLTLVLLGEADGGKQLASQATGERDMVFFSADSVEERVMPFLSVMRGRREVEPDRRYERPTQAELFAIAEQWDQLSPSFQAAYNAVAAIPPNMATYASPGGRFDIIYTTDGINRVDASDAYGYGSSDWRQRTPGPNGVPDYVDEVAWACDSAWSMEIERFGFVPPHASSSVQYPSDRYKMAVLNLDSAVNDSGDTVLVNTGGYYGLTWPMGPQPAPDIGFASRVELRNNWNGAIWQDVAGNDYEAFPERAIRVTCAHEFFHAIQYAMTHNLLSATRLDDFPSRWVEATAVLMEELGFDSVNDYIQYCGPYFHDPTSPVLRGDASYISVYNSSVAAIYLYEFAPGGAGIGFVHNVFFRNYSSPTPYPSALMSASNAQGTSWPRLLGSFHARSYFTGPRSAQGRFIGDAPLLPAWDYREDTSTGTSKISSDTAVKAFGMWTTAYARRPGDDNTLTIQFVGRRYAIPHRDSLWGVHVLLRPRGAESFDSIVAMRVHADGCDTLEIGGWEEHEEALAVVTNAHGEALGKALVAFDTLVAPEPPQIPIAIYPNPVRLRSADSRLTIHATGLTQAQVYTIAGDLVFSSGNVQKNDNIIWDLPGARPAAMPGTYFAVITTRDSLSGPVRMIRRKLFILP